MMDGKLFSLFKRGKFWYVRFKKPDNSYTTAQTTKKTNRYEADKYAVEIIKKNGNVSTKKTFGLIAKDFFAWDGTWATDRRIRGIRISERHCIEQARVLNNYVLPVFEKIRLDKVNRAAIKSFRNDLYGRGLSGETINHVLSVVKSVLESAEEQGLINGIPRIDRAAINTKNRGILTVEEVKELLENISIWSDYRAYVASLLAASSGLRLGEILGLVISDYHPEGRYIHCRRSWDQYLRRLNPTTKTGRARNVFIPPSVITALDKLIALSPNPKTSESFIFYADKSYIYPTEPKIITKAFFKAMEDIGISEKERRERNITFHSHRHFLNSLLVNANIPIQKIQSITGHLTAEMTQHYYHLDDMRDVQQVQEGIFDFGTAI